MLSFKDFKVVTINDKQVTDGDLRAFAYYWPKIFGFIRLEVKNDTLNISTGNY